MIPFLDLKGINAQYRAELIEASTRVIDSGWYIQGYRDWETDRKSTRLNSSHSGESRMPSSA